MTMCRSTWCWDVNIAMHCLLFSRYNRNRTLCQILLRAYCQEHSHTPRCSGHTHWDGYEKMHYNHNRNINGATTNNIVCVFLNIFNSRGNKCIFYWLSNQRFQPSPSMYQSEETLFVPAGFNVDTLPVYAKRSQRMVITARKYPLSLTIGYRDSILHQWLP